MPVHLCAMDYRRLPAAVRDRVVLSEADGPRALRRLTGDSSLEEAVLLITCHRCELYTATADPERVARWAREVLTGRDPAGAPVETWRQMAGGDAIHHLCRVACGLDSAVLGEAQVLGQVRRAWQEAVAAGTIGTTLDRLFRLAVSAGKRARRLPGVEGRTASLADVAVQLVEARLDTLHGRRVLVIGSGTMAQLTVRALAVAGVAEVTVAARRPEQVPALGNRVTAVPLGRLSEVLVDVDVAVSTTSAPSVILDVPTVRQVMAQRRRPLVLVDLAVPRDIDPGVREVAGVILLDADEIVAHAGISTQPPTGVVARLEAIAAHAAATFERWERARAAVPSIVRLRRRAEQIQRAELARALRRLPDLTDRERDVVAAMAAGIVNRILYAPTARLKAEAAERDGDLLRRALDTLFALDREQE